MRIKSYFAPSVQAAIAMARREFGDGVTLVTSHIASPDSRHLGEYEVVFAIDDEETAPAPPKAVPEAPGRPERTPVFTEFQQALMHAVVQQPPVADAAAKIQQIRQLLVELGIEPAILTALVTMIEQSCAARSETASAVAAADLVIPCAPKPAPEQDLFALRPVPAQPAKSGDARLSAAELAFIQSVSDERKTDSRL